MSGGSSAADRDDPDLPTGHAAGSRGLRRIKISLFAAALATFALLYSTQPLLPALATDFDVSPGASALSVSLATWGLGLALLVAGPVSEMIGRTWLMQASVWLSAGIGVAAALAPSWHVLLALRTLQGVALAGLPAVAVAYLREEVDDRVYGRAAGLFIAGNAIGGMSGRLVAGALADLGGWRLALGGIAVLGLGCAAVVQVLLPQSRRFRPAPATVRSVVETTRAVLTDPALLALYAVAATLMGGFVAVYNALTFRLVAPPYGLPLVVAGLVFTTYAVGSAASVLTGSAADRWGRRRVAPLPCLVMIAGIALTLGQPLWLVVTGVAVMTTGFFGAHGLAAGWVGARAHAGAGGTAQASALYMGAYYGGSSVFGALAGVCWSAGGWPAVAALASGLATCALVLMLLLRRTASLA